MTAKSSSPFKTVAIVILAGKTAYCDIKTDSKGGSKNKRKRRFASVFFIEAS
jgi:hypothetical protein